MSNSFPWSVAGSYFEVCNCEAICPCRRHGERKGGRSTYGTSNQEYMKVGDVVSARTAKAVLSDEPVTCGIPGHDRPGQEIVAESFQVDDHPLRWEFQGRCGFAVDFAYRSEA